MPRRIRVARRADDDEDTAAARTNIDALSVSDADRRRRRRTVLAASSACAPRTARVTSGVSNGSGPERIERGVERDGRDVLPQPSCEPDDERLVDVEVDAVARAPRAVDGDAPTRRSRRRCAACCRTSRRSRGSCGGGTRRPSRRPRYSPLIAVLPGTRQTMSRRARRRSAIASLPNAAKTRRVERGVRMLLASRAVPRASRRPPRRSPSAAAATPGSPCAAARTPRCSRQLLLLHQQPLRALDHLARGERLGERLRLRRARACSSSWRARAVWIAGSRSCSRNGFTR